MSGGRLAELRLAWGLLGLLLAIAFSGAPVLPWLPIVSLPWLAGAAVVFSGRLAPRVVDAGRALAVERPARFALQVLLCLIGLSALAFSAAAALFLTTCGGAALLVVAARARPEATGQLVVGTALALVSGVTAFGLAEVVLRSTGLAPRLGVQSPAEAAAWEERYDRLWERNVLGIRSPYETTARKPGTWRVLALGDSFTWGDKIPSSEDTWPAQLEAELRRRFAEREIEVVNLGQGGFTTVNEAERLRRLGWQFDPDVVVVQFFANDPLPSGPNFERVGTEWLWPVLRILPHRFREGWIDSSALLAVVESGLYRALVVPDDERRAFAPIYEEDFRGWLELRKALAEMGEAARARGVPIALLLYPSFPRAGWTDGSHPLDDFYDRVAAAGRSAGFQVVDLRPVFAAESDDWERWWATPYDAHPSAAAHARAAATLADALVGSGAIPPRREDARAVAAGS